MDREIQSDHAKRGNYPFTKFPAVPAACELANTVAIYCPGRMAEHLKSTGGFTFFWCGPPVRLPSAFKFMNLTAYILESNHNFHCDAPDSKDDDETRDLLTVSLSLKNIFRQTYEITFNQNSNQG